MTLQVRREPYAAPVDRGGRMFMRNTVRDWIVRAMIQFEIPDGAIDIPSVVIVDSEELFAKSVSQLFEAHIRPNLGDLNAVYLQTEDDVSLFTQGTDYYDRFVIQPHTVVLLSGSVSDIDLIAVSMEALFWTLETSVSGVSWHSFRKYYEQVNNDRQYEFASALTLFRAACNLFYTLLGYIPPRQYYVCSQDMNHVGIYAATDPETLQLLEKFFALKKKRDLQDIVANHFFANEDNRAAGRFELIRSFFT